MAGNVEYALIHGGGESHEVVGWTDFDGRFCGHVLQAFLGGQEYLACFGTDVQAVDVPDRQTGSGAGL